MNSTRIILALISGIILGPIPFAPVYGRTLILAPFLAGVGLTCAIVALSIRKGE